MQAPTPFLQHDPTAAEVERLEHDVNTWLIVAAVGWFIGLMWVTGPIAWYKGNRICARYRELGRNPSDNANTLRIVGLVTTVLVVLGMVAVCGIAALGVGLAWQR